MKIHTITYFDTKADEETFTRYFTSKKKALKELDNFKARTSVKWSFDEAQFVDFYDKESGERVYRKEVAVRSNQKCVPFYYHTIRVS